MDKFEFNKAVDYHKKNQLKKAIKIYQKIVSQSENEEVLFLLGTAYYQNNEFEKSIKYLTI
jgi:tetratricopeptide (TPR) repeat protein